MVICKQESIYNKLKNDLTEIAENEEYDNLSLAFSDWFLRVQYGLNTQEIAESIIDGSGDCGIDAFIYNEEFKELEVFQFKFPSQLKTITKENNQNDINKLIYGFELLIDRNSTCSLDNASSEFRKLHDYLKDVEVHNFKINFVSFNKGIVDNIASIENFINKIKNELGIEISFTDYNAKTITNIYDKLQRQNSIQVTIPYKNLQQSYSINDVNSFVGVVNSQNLLESIKHNIGVIFDENIRLVETNSKVNNGIKKTASSEHNANMFYFYNNGITFICDNVQVSPNNLTVTLHGVSIVNGCQTVTSLFELHEKNKLSNQVDILVRIIKISDYDERANITQFLNSQNQIKESYFISNHTIIRELQKKLCEKNYFLERQINESYFKGKFINDKISKGKKILKLGDVIQYYTGYYIDKLAATAKRHKNNLFLSDNIEEILSKITPEGVIESYETYKEVSRVITMYRRNRRNRTNTEFSELLNITPSELEEQEAEYLFVNTADILLLNTSKFMKKKYPENTVEKNIILSIDIIKHLIADNNELRVMAPATLTKSQLIYTTVENYFINVDK